MKRWTRVRGTLAVLAMVAAACATAPPAPEKPSLYKRLGGREGIRLVVDDFVALLAADPRVSTRFAHLKPPDVERLKTHAADQVCEVTGGPCSYLGRDMKTAHKGLNITEAEWEAAVENLRKALDKHRVPRSDQDELLALLAPMKADIVGQ